MQPLRALLADWRGARRDMEQVMKNMPRTIGIESVRIVKQNFNLHGYDSGNGFDKWEDRKAATNKAYSASRGKGKQGNYKGSVFSPNKPLLKQTLRLYNSIQYKTRGMSSVEIGVDPNLVPYARAHNEGLHHEPKRQYMPTPSQPPNAKMRKQYEVKFTQAREKALARFKK